MKTFTCGISAIFSTLLFFYIVQIKATNDESKKKIRRPNGFIKVQYGNSHYMPLSEEGSHQLAISRAMRIEQSISNKKGNPIHTSSSHSIYRPKAIKVEEIQIKGNPHQKNEKQFNHSSFSPFKKRKRVENTSQHQINENVDEIMKKKFKSWKTTKEINEQQTDKILKKSFQGWKTNAEIKSQSNPSTISNLPQQQQLPQENENDLKMKKYFSKWNSTPSKKSG